MVVCRVLVADEPGPFTAFYVSFQVVDISSVLRIELVLFDGNLIDFRFRFDVAGLVGKDATGEMLEYRVVFQEVLFVGVVDVGEKDKSMTLVVEVFDAVPHYLVGSKDIDPGVHELIHRSGMPEGFGSPWEIFFRVNASSFKLVLAFKDVVEAIVGVVEILGNQSLQAGDEVNANDHAADIE